MYIEQGNVVNQAAELGHNLAGSHDRKKILVSSQWQQPSPFNQRVAVPSIILLMQVHMGMGQSQLFWGSLGTRVLTHSHITACIYHLPMVGKAERSSILKWQKSGASNSPPQEQPKIGTVNIPFSSRFTHHLQQLLVIPPFSLVKSLFCGHVSPSTLRFTYLIRGKPIYNTLLALRSPNQHHVWIIVTVWFLLDNLIELVKCTKTKRIPTTYCSTYNVTLRLNLPFISGRRFFRLSSTLITTCHCFFHTWIQKKH